MRWLFLFVLFLNLAYIAWEIGRPVTDVYSNIKTNNNNVQPIVLLSEIGHQRPVEKPQNQPDEVASKQGSDKQDGSVHSGPEQGSTEQTGTGQVGAEQIDIEHAATGKADIEQLSTAQTGGRAKETVLLSQKRLPAQTLNHNDSCYTLGPFRDLGVLRDLTRELKPYVVAVDFRGREAKEQSLYWAYIKPEKNREAAIATGNLLKANQIKDYFVIRKGEKINGVSLGYFRNKAGASGLVNRVKQLGFDAVLEAVYKTYTVYWLDYQVGGDVKIPQTIFDKYIEAAKQDKIKRLGRDCAV